MRFAQIKLYDDGIYRAGVIVLNDPSLIPVFSEGFPYAMDVTNVNALNLDGTVAGGVSAGDVYDPATNIFTRIPPEPLPEPPDEDPFN